MWSLETIIRINAKKMNNKVKKLEEKKKKASIVKVA